MTKQHSFSRIENQLLPGYRNRISMAESTEDVKKFFCYTVQDLFRLVFEGNLVLEYEDVFLQPERTPAYGFSERVLADSGFISIWNSSDLPNLILRFADTAAHRYKHLMKNPEKTEAKIRV